MITPGLLTLSVALLFTGAWLALRISRRRRAGALLASGMAAAGIGFVPLAWSSWSVTAEPLPWPYALAGLVTSALLCLGIAHLTQLFQAGSSNVEALRSVEEALVESESRYRSMLAAMTEGAILRDGEGKVLAVNAAAEELLGRKLDELKQLAENPGRERVLDAHGEPLDPEQLPSLVSLRTGQAIRNQIVGVGRPDDSTVWLSINAAPLMLPDSSRPHGTMATMTDVTEARRTQEELLRSHERTFAILESITDGFLSMNREGQLEFVNASAATMLGVDANALVGEDIWESLPELRGTDLPAHFQRAMDRADVVHFEAYLDQQEDWIEGAVYPFENGVSLYFRRNTAEQEALQALALSEERFRLLAENVPVVVYLCDGSAGFPFLFLSEAVVDLTGWPREAFLSGETSFQALYHPDDVEAILPEVELALAERRRYELTVRLRHADGSYRWVQEIGVGVFRDDALLYLEGYVLDITARQAHEERQRLLMAELDHRVKNNISTIMALAQQTIGRSADLPEFQERFLGRVRAMARTHEALAAAHWEGVVLHDVVRLTLGPYFGISEERLEIEGPRLQLPGGAAASIGLALHELTTNAVKYGALSDDRGSLRIEWTHEDDRVRLVWTERGIRLPTQPAEQPSDPRAAGGMGMTLLRGLIEYELGGKVTHEFDDKGLTCVLDLGLGHVRDDGSLVP